MFHVDQGPIMTRALLFASLIAPAFSLGASGSQVSLLRKPDVLGPLSDHAVLCANPFWREFMITLLRPLL